MTLRGGIGALLAAGLAACAATAPSASRPDTANAYANFLVGRLANLREDHQAASDRLYRALIASPGDPNLLDGALTAALATGDVARVRAIARMNVRGEAPASQHLVRAVDALAASRWRVATAEATAVHGNMTDQLTARLLLSWAHVGAGHVDEAAPDLQRLSNVRPFGGLFAYQQAMALDFAGRAAAARTAYDAAEQGGLFLPPGIERHADFLARNGSRDQALTILSTPDDGRTSNPAIQAAAARLHAGQNASPAPLTPARGAAIGLYGLGAIYAQESDGTTALATLTLALMLDPQLDAARLLFADTESDLHHPDAARAALAAIPAESAYAENARIMQSLVLAQEGRNDDAVTLARANAEHGGPRSKRALADLYRSLGSYAEAEAIYSALIAAEPSDSRDWRLFFARGACRDRLHRYPEAEADLRHALQISPEQPEVLNYLGYAWVDRGVHLDEALTMIQHAAELRPDSGAIVDSLGWAYYRLGQYDHAVETEEHALELLPADAELNDHLGDIYWTVGRRTEARYQWNRALSLNPDQAMRTTIQEKLAHGLPATRAAAR